MNRTLLGYLLAFVPGLLLLATAILTAPNPAALVNLFGSL